MWLLLTVLLLFGSVTTGIPCPYGCPTSCTAPQGNFTADVHNGVIYVQEGTPLFENGNLTYPFSSIANALDGLKNSTEDVTIIIGDGEFVFFDEYVLTEYFGGVQKVAWADYPNGITTRRKINFISENGKESTTLVCQNQETDMLRVDIASMGPTTEILTLSLSFSGLTFDNCNRIIAFSGENLTLTDLNFQNGVVNAIELYFPPVFIANGLYFDTVSSEIYGNYIGYALINGSTFVHQSQINAYRSIQISRSGTLEVSNCQFTNNSAGALYISSLSELKLKDSNFQGVKGSATVQIDTTNTILERLKFKNIVSQVSVLRLQSGYHLLSNIEFTGISGPTILSTFFVFLKLSHVSAISNAFPDASYGFLYSDQSEIIAHDLIIQDNSGPLIQVGSIYSPTRTNLSISDSIISRNKYPGGIPNYFSFAILNVINTQFFENSPQTYFISSSYSLVSFSNSSFETNSGTSIFRVSESFISFDHVDAHSNSLTILSISAGSSAEISHSTFKNNTSVDRSCIICSGCNLKVSDSEFSDNILSGSKSTGAAIYLNPSQGINATGEITNSTFLNNVADFGGALFVYVLNSSFVNIVNCSFEHNLAKRRGAAIYSGHNFYLPSIHQSTTFDSNTALLSGDDFAGPANGIFWDAPPTLQTNVSGYYLPDIEILLKDSYGNVVFLSEDETLFIQIGVESQDGKKREVGAQVIGETQKAFINGRLVFSHVRVTGTPGEYQIFLRSTSPNYDPQVFVLNFATSISPCDQDRIVQPIPDSSYGICVTPNCQGGCFRGKCVRDNQCLCDEGWAGSSCEFKAGERYYPDYDQVAVIIIVILTAILIIFTIFVGITIFAFKNTPVFKSASPIFCLIIVFGSLMSYTSIFTFIGKPSPVLCTSNLWLVNLAFIIAFSAVLVKNWRIYQIFENQVLKVKAIPTKELLIYSSILIAIEIVLLIIWSAVATPTIQEVDPIGERLYANCGHSNTTFSLVMLIVTLAYNAGITLATVWLAFKTRNVMSAFRDSLGIALSVYNFAAIGAIILPLIYGTAKTLSAEAHFLIKTITILFVTTFGLLALFGPKIYIVYFSKEKNVAPRDGFLSSSKDNSPSILKSSISQINMDLTQEDPSLLVNMNGTLSFQVGILKKWRPRFLELHAKAGLITIFKTNEQSDVGEVFNIQKISVVNRDDYLPGCFSLSTSSMTYLIQAESKGMCLNWITAINRVREYHAQK